MAYDCYVGDKLTKDIYSETTNITRVHKGTNLVWIKDKSVMEKKIQALIHLILNLQVIIAYYLLVMVVMLLLITLYYLLMMELKLVMVLVEVLGEMVVMFMVMMDM